MRKKYTLKESLSKHLSNNPLIVLIWALVIFFSSLLTIIEGSSLLYRFSTDHFFKKHQQYIALGKLETNTDISNLIKLIGTPSLIENNSELVKYTFAEKNYYLSAVTDLNGRILSFAVTSRNKHFQPAFTLPGYEINGYLGSVTLNKTRFSDLYPNIQESLESSLGIGEEYEELRRQSFVYETTPTCYLQSGVRRFKYFEGSYLGNPSNYQTIYLGINDAGYYDYNAFPSFDSSIWNLHASPDCVKVNGEYRNNVINTFVITAPFMFGTSDISTKSADLIFGVDYDQVRVWEDIR